MARIFVVPEQIRGESLRIRGEDTVHLARVLRLGPGDPFSALDGTGMEYLARIQTVDRDEIEAVIESRTARRTEPALRLYLGQALPKGDKMEQVIRKGTELGMAGFFPLLTERCVPVPQGEGATRRLARWQRIAAEAAGQSGRAIVPTVSPLRSWAEMVRDFSRYDPVLLPWEGETTTALKATLSERRRPVNTLALIGPEGGLTLDEVALAKEAGAVPLTLGPRILRTETAGLVIGAALFYHFDELAPRVSDDEKR